MLEGLSLHSLGDLLFLYFKNKEEIDNTIQLLNKLKETFEEE